MEPCASARQGWDKVVWWCVRLKRRRKHILEKREPAARLLTASRWGCFSFLSENILQAKDALHVRQNCGRRTAWSLPPIDKTGRSFLFSNHSFIRFRRITCILLPAGAAAAAAAEGHKLLLHPAGEDIVRNCEESLRCRFIGSPDRTLARHKHSGTCRTYRR
jgi:hypothetical protein